MTKIFGKGLEGGISPKNNKPNNCNIGSSRYNWQSISKVFMKVGFINWFNHSTDLTL